MLVLGSFLESGNLGASKQFSTDLKSKIINYYELEEGYKKLSGRFGLSIATVRNVVQKWKATGTVLVKERYGRLKKIQERHRRRMVRMVTDKPQTTSRELQEHLAADGVVVHRSTIQRTLHQDKLIGRVMRKKPFLSVRHKKSRMRDGKAHLDKPEAFWKKILWSDETKIVIWSEQEEVCMVKKTH